MTSAGGVGAGGISVSGPTMEGTLYKWTNYWHGWQPRWFLLDQGVLTYYKSREEVCQGCKGSVKISACEIVPHQLDSKRLDIIIPSEQHYYLKAASETERQQWLVLLGSVKQASASGSAFSAGTTQMNLSPTAAGAVAAIVGAGHTGAIGGAPSQLLMNGNAIKIKKSELRLCCDMLMQQAHAIKTSQEIEAKLEAAETLTSTCDMFIRCLDSLMKLAECVERLDDEDTVTATTAAARELRPPLLEFANAHGTVTGMVGSLEKLQPQSQRRAMPGAPVPSSSSPSLGAGSGTGVTSAVIHRATSHKFEKNSGNISGGVLVANGAELTQESATNNNNNNNSYNNNNNDNSGSISTNKELSRGDPHIDGNRSSQPPLTTKKEETGPSLASMPSKDPNSNGVPACETSPTDEARTFFSEMAHSFRDLRLVDKQIPIEEFLECCRALLPVFDALGSTAFAPVKMDIQGNIDKLEKHQKETRCSTLQALVQRELDSSTVWSKGSAADALLWLKRALAFICCFLKEACCQSGEVDLALCASQAYSETLKKHHNFVVRGIFSMAVRALPYYSTFLKTMAPTPQAASHPQYEETLKRHGVEYTRQLEEVVRIIDVFYVRNDIVSPLNL